MAYDPDCNGAKVVRICLGERFILITQNALQSEDQRYQSLAAELLRHGQL